MHIDTLLGDWMHVAALGTQPIAVGNVLEELCTEGRWGQFLECHGWKERMNCALKLGHIDFRGWLRERGLQCSVPVFSTNMLSKEALHQHPTLKCKARACIYVTEWLYSISACDVGTWHNQLRATVLWGYLVVF